MVRERVLEIVVNYTESFKAKMVQRMVAPNAISAISLSKEVGVSQSQLSRWLRTHAFSDECADHRDARPLHPRWAVGLECTACAGRTPIGCASRGWRHDAVPSGAGRGNIDGPKTPRPRPTRSRTAPPESSRNASADRTFPLTTSTSPRRTTSRGWETSDGGRMRRSTGNASSRPSDMENPLTTIRSASSTKR